MVVLNIQMEKKSIHRGIENSRILLVRLTALDEIRHLVRTRNGVGAKVIDVGGIAGRRLLPDRYTTYDDLSFSVRLTWAKYILNI
jgi:hypothetical protein